MLKGNSYSAEGHEAGKVLGREVRIENGKADKSKSAIVNRERSIANVQQITAGILFVHLTSYTIHLAANGLLLIANH